MAEPIVGDLAGRGTNELRELLIRFNVPFRFVPAGGGPGRSLLQRGGLEEGRLPVMIRHDGYTMVQPAPSASASYAWPTATRSPPGR
ncbi:MAG TPA: hypothetical protein VFX25_41315 [Streptosporangiaceae bacterium]|nr:hypothetical protein [Streptosporangiaceae bacterium]